MSEQQSQTPSNDALLQARTPEALAALVETSQQAEPPKTETPPADAATTDQAASASTGTPAEPAPTEPVGVATKSGKGVIPYQVLFDERERARNLHSQLEATQRELRAATERLKALPANASADDKADALAELTDEEIAAAEADFPLLAKVARAVRNAQPSTSTQPTAAAQEQADEQLAEESARANAARDAMSGLTVLQTLAASGGRGWDRAKEIDAELQQSTEYASRPLSERFASVQERVAKELGLTVPTPPKQSQTPAPAAVAVDPSQAPSIRPNTTSDIVGGASSGHDQISDQADGFALAQRFMKMSQADLTAALRRSV